MSSRSRSLIVAIALALGCGTSPDPPSPWPPPAVVSPAIGDEVDAWLERAVVAPHNGMNPQIELPPRLVTEGVAAFERRARTGVAAWRRAAAFALAHHPEPATLRPLWRALLDADEPDIRFRALVTLADLHDPHDLEPVLRAYLAYPDLAHPASVRLRDWQDRRAVIALIELLSGPDQVAGNAAESLAQSPGVPELPAEPTTEQASVHHPAGLWTAAPESRVAPYRRWWSEAGRAAFATECAWWTAFAGEERAVCAAR